jgi:hypothetical protein
MIHLEWKYNTLSCINNFQYIQLWKQFFRIRKTALFFIGIIHPRNSAITLFFVFTYWQYWKHWKVFWATIIEMRGASNKELRSKTRGVSENRL